MPATNMSTSQVLESVRTQMKIRMHLGQRRRQEDKDAKTLEHFLRSLKNSYDNQNYNTPLPSNYQAAIDIIKGNNPDGLNLLRKMMSIDESKTVQGNYLEKFMERFISRVQKAVSEAAFKQSQKALSARTGSEKVQLVDPNDIAYNAIKEVYENQQINKSWLSNNGEDFDPLDSYFSNEVPGKIDNSGLNMYLVFKKNANEVLENIANILQNATFTDKNYTSSSTNFGDTNPYRVFSSVTSPLSLADTAGSYKRMVNCMIFDNPQHSKNKSRFYRIRQIYELTGFGQEYSDNNLQKRITSKLGITYTKYLIYNNPSNNDIFVTSTASIINNFISNFIDNNDSDISLTAEEALYGRLKSLNLLQISIYNQY